MNHKRPDGENEKELKMLLQQEFPPCKNAELRRDLWPEMLRRLDAQKPMRMPWFDWALVAAVATALLLFPGTIPALLYHL